ncbi:MAG: NUDIX domain-containing protein [Candidatus Gracilibacteria bacterium]|nr:NUDIX domain-containing protein [Candidatus Gracilibacteria bacterium]
MESPILATDVVVFNIRKGKLKVLLIKMNKEPFVGLWALPGGFIGEKELCLDAAHRILYEASSVSDLYIEQLKVFDAIDRDPKARIVSIAHMAIIKKDDLSIKTNDSYSDIAWFSVDELPVMAYDHLDIIKYGLERLEGKVTYSTLSLSLMPEKFTLSELQSVFEIVLKKDLDKRNFRKKLLKSGVIEDTGEKKTIGIPRPASLFRAINKDLEFVDLL